MSLRSLRRAARAGGLLLAAAWLCPAAPAGQATFRSESALVLTAVQVRDAAGRPVPGLAPRDFRIYADGRPRPITYFEPAQSPLSALLLLDTSSSMRGQPLEEARRAAREFLRHCSAEDQVALMAFNETPRLISGFAAPGIGVEARLDALHAAGGTAVFDAVDAALDALQQAEHPRRVLLLLGDGKDEESRVSFSALERRVGSRGVILYAVGEYSADERRLFVSGGRYYKPPELDVNLNPAWILTRLARLSGGEAFFPAAGESLEALFARIAAGARQLYVVGFVPEGPPANRFHTLRVEVAATPGPVHKVDSRAAYWY